MSLSQLGGDDLSRSFLGLVENGKSRISLRALSIVAQRLGLSVSLFLSEQTESAARAAQLLFHEAEIAFDERRLEESLRLLNDAEDSAPTPLGNQGRFLRARVLVECGRIGEAVTVLRAGIGDLAGEEDEYSAARYRYLLGATLYRAAAYVEAEHYLREALETAVTDVRDHILTGKITVCLGHIWLYARGEPDRAIGYYSQAVEHFGKVRDFHTQATVYSGLSLAFKRQGDIEKALEYTRLSVAMYRASHDRRGTVQELNNTAVALEEQGNFEQATAIARQALAQAEELSAMDLQATLHNTLGTIYLRQGDVDRAANEAHLAERLAPDDRSMPRVASWRLQAEVADSQGDSVLAEALYERVLTSLKETNRLRSFTETALAYSSMLERRGKTSRALHFALEAARVNVPEAHRM